MVKIFVIALMKHALSVQMRRLKMANVPSVIIVLLIIKRQQNLRIHLIAIKIWKNIF